MINSVPNESSIEQLAQDVSTLHAELSNQAQRFSSQSNIHCLSGCGACCSKPNGVWCTITEMLPLAMKLYEEERAEQFLKFLDERVADDICPLFHAENSGVSGKGRCQNYEYRPTICRVFGSGAVKAKDGSLSLLLCAIQKQEMRNQNRELRMGTDDLKSDPPVADEWASKIASLTGNFNFNRQYPINEAIKGALEVLYWQQLPNI